MDVKAILMVGGREREPGDTRPAGSIGGVPIAYLDVLGLPVLERVLQRLHQFGVAGVTLISDAPAEAEPYVRRVTLRPDMPWISASGKQFWDAAEEAFNQHAQAGAELVIALRIGGYVELDYEEMVQHHLDHRCAVTMAVDSEGVSLDIFVLSASRRNDAGALFRSQLRRMRTKCKRFPVSGYVNRLQTAAELRQLALDGLLRRNVIAPVGTEIKPGVWVGEGAHVHRKARVVAPAFIGAHSKVRASTLITRSTVIEHHVDIDCGTVVENSTVLPFTYVGAGLDVMHSVVGFKRLTHLIRKVEVEISDNRLLGMAAISPFSRTVGSAAALFAFLPKQIYRGFFSQSQNSAADLPESLEQPAAALEKPVMEAQGSGPEASEFPSTLAVARRYGEK